MHVLVVDDQQVDRLIIKRQLIPDFQVTTLSSAKEAKAFALIHNFDVALLNVMLREDMDCLELLSDLRGISSFNFLPLAITCHLDKLRYKKLLNSGFKAVLQKPFNTEIFHDIVMKNIHTHH